MRLMLEANEQLPVKALLGETLTANIEDETHIYLEQVSVAPSITRVLITSIYKKLRLWGEVRVGSPAGHQPGLLKEQHGRHQQDQVQHDALRPDRVRGHLPQLVG